MEPFQETRLGYYFYKITGLPKTRLEAAERYINKEIIRRTKAERMLNKLTKNTSVDHKKEYRRMVADMRRTQLANKRETGNPNLSKKKLHVLQAKALYIEQARKAVAAEQNEIKQSREGEMLVA